ncbi:MAG: hypothetical protein VX589_04350 [Myxococcota bacterium]|nr:hypothetical protein [Myxococcota bacterium]
MSTLGRIFLWASFVLLMPLVVLAAARAGTQPKSDSSPRSTRPFTVAYHSHWFLLGGVRASYRLLDNYMEVAGQIAQSVTTGCAIQAPKCETSVGFATGIRRYLTNTPFTGYLGLNVHYLADGLRFIDEPGFALDASAGVQHQSAGGFVIGIGYSYFFFDGPGAGTDVDVQGWVCSELGYAF